MDPYVKPISFFPHLKNSKTAVGYMSDHAYKKMIPPKGFNNKKTSGGLTAPRTARVSGRLPVKTF